MMSVLCCIYIIYNYCNTINPLHTSFPGTRVPLLLEYPILVLGTTEATLELYAALCTSSPLP